MNFITKWLIEKEGEHMLTNLIGKIDGSKTYVLAALGILVALIGHFWGPVHVINGVDIPVLSWGEVWTIVWNGGLIAALRHGVAKTTA